MLQRDHTATQHAVSYREGTSVGNGCGVRGQSEGEEEDRKTIKKSEEGEGTQRDIFRWSNLKANFAWVTHFSKWVPLLAVAVHQLVDPPTEVKVSQGGGALPRPRRVHRGRQTTNTSRRVLRRVCVSCNECHLACKRSGRFLQAHLPGLRNWGTVHHLLVLYWLINRYRVYCRSPERVCKSC